MALPGSAKYLSLLIFAVEKRIINISPKKKWMFVQSCGFVFKEAASNKLSLFSTWIQNSLFTIGSFFTQKCAGVLKKYVFFFV